MANGEKLSPTPISYEINGKKVSPLSYEIIGVVNSVNDPALVQALGERILATEIPEEDRDAVFTAWFNLGIKLGRDHEYGAVADYLSA